MLKFWIKVKAKNKICYRFQNLHYAPDLLTASTEKEVNPEYLKHNTCIMAGMGHSGIICWNDCIHTIQLLPPSPQKTINKNLMFLHSDPVARTRQLLVFMYCLC